MQQPATSPGPAELSPVVLGQTADKSVMEPRLHLRYWGVRGSTPTPERRNAEVGGNTPCVEVRGPKGELIVLDAGSGIRALGQALSKEPGIEEIHLFISHFHWDHIQGLPYFTPLFDPRKTIRIYTGWDAAVAREALASQMRPPHHPIMLDAVAANWDIVALPAKGGVSIGSLRMHQFELNHPQKAYGVRIDGAGSSIVYATDSEPGNAELEAAKRDHARNASLIIHDAQYRVEEYPSREGWGHSTWADAAALAEAVNAANLALFHHDPTRDDAAVAEMEREARGIFPATVAAREAAVVKL